MSARAFAAALFFVFAVPFGPARAFAQEVRVFAGQPGPYEIHEYLHRPNTVFDKEPYFATHPPVYYGTPRMTRSYGWTPYPYLGSQYSQPLNVLPDSAAEQPKKQPKKKTAKPHATGA